VSQCISLGFICPRIFQNERAIWVDSFCMEWLMLRDTLRFPGVRPVLEIRNHEILGCPRITYG